MTTDTLAGLFAAAVAADPARPLLTWYDDATGERTELSGATLANWAAKTANLLVDGAGLSVGDTAAVLLPPHWQTGAILLGCWTSGVSVSTGAADVVFGTGAEPADAPERFATALHPFALPIPGGPPAGWSDYTAEVRTHGDHFRPYQPVTGADAALDGRSHAAVVALAVQRADDLGITGGRVLIDVDAHPDPVDWLLAPLAAGATIVACAHLDRAALARRLAAEQASPAG